MRQAETKLVAAFRNFENMPKHNRRKLLMYEHETCIKNEILMFTH
jgi:hypothetical protein